jgi:hypothetical protein
MDANADGVDALIDALRMLRKVRLSAAR